MGWRQQCLAWALLACGWICEGFTARPGLQRLRRRDRTVRWVRLQVLHNVDEDDEDATSVYLGPLVKDSDSVVASLAVEDIGLVLEIAESVVVPGSRGLFLRCAPGVEETLLPEMTLLAGYARGTWEASDMGDKTVGFALPGPETAVFFDRELLSVEQALAVTADRHDGPARIYAHEVLYDEAAERLVLQPSAEADTPRYFVPDPVDDFTAKGFGQYCNDLAFEAGMDDEASYVRRSNQSNVAQLVWRLEFDDARGELRPSWPVSVLSRDMCFQNSEAMEIGTTYGWSYWQATVDIQDLSVK